MAIVSPAIINELVHEAAADSVNGLLFRSARAWEFVRRHGVGLVATFCPAVGEVGQTGKTTLSGGINVAYCALAPGIAPMAVETPGIDLRFINREFLAAVKKPGQPGSA